MFYDDAAVVAWATFWKWVILLGGAGFVLLLLFSIVFGARDIGRLFATLHRRQQENAPEETH